jgi:hypothetical protein
MPVKGLTPSERTLRAQLAANVGWAFTQDRTARTAAARRAAFAKFEQAVDPDGVLPLYERAKRAENLRRAHLQQMAFKSAKARRRQAQVRQANQPQAGDDGAA